MTQELLYTSAPKGLKPGSRGFCTVVTTQGMSAPMAASLESLSAYRHVYPPGDPNAAQNPVVWSHVKMPAAGKTWHVLSRIADYGLDYSDRTNKLAHHVVLDPRELPEGGPAWLLAQPEFMLTQWDGQTRVLANGRPARPGAWGPEDCTNWQILTGDAGWGGVLAESFLANPDRPVFVVGEPGMDMLTLFVEAIALLPASRRWEVTFSTYFTNLPPTAVCNWRCVLADSPEAQQSRRFVQALRIDLCSSMPRANGGDLVALARSGWAGETGRPVLSDPRVDPLVSDDDLVEELELAPTGEAEPAPETVAGKEIPAFPPAIRSHDVAATRSDHTDNAPPLPRARDRIEAMYAADGRRRSTWARRIVLMTTAIATTVLLIALAFGFTHFLQHRAGRTESTALPTDTRAALHGAQQEVVDASDARGIVSATSTTNERQTGSRQVYAESGTGPVESKRVDPSGSTGRDSGSPATSPVPAATTAPQDTTSQVGDAAEHRLKLTQDARVRFNDLVAGKEGLFVYADDGSLSQLQVRQPLNDGAPVLSWKYAFPSMPGYVLQRIDSTAFLKQRITFDLLSLTRLKGTTAPHDLQIDVETDNKRAGARNVFRHGIIAVDGALQTGTLFLALSGEPKVPKQTAFSHGGLDWEINAWGRCLPELLVELQLTHGERESTATGKVSRPEGTHEFEVALRGEDQWPVGLSRPRIGVECVLRSEPLESASLRFRAVDLAWKPSPQTAADVQTLEYDCKVAQVILEGAANPPEFVATHLLKDALPGPSGKRSRLRLVLDSVAGKKDYYQKANDAQMVALLNKIEKQTLKITDQAKEIAATMEAWRMARIRTARVYYRVGVDGQVPVDVSLLIYDAE